MTMSATATRTITALALVTSIMSGMSLHAADDVRGELVEYDCYMKDKQKNIGLGHHECAVVCARKGQRMAVVTDAGDVYIITGQLTNDRNAKLVIHITHQVIVTGNVTEAGGTKSIEATTLKMAPKM